MFSLIIVLISITLVVALVAATIYYGGDASKQGASRAAAAALVSQAGQIAAAGTIATSQGGVWPATAVGPQFGEPYLKSMPIPPKSAYAEGVGAPSAADWTYYIPDVPDPAVKSHHFVLSNKISKEVCLAVNKGMGFTGIPAAWDGVSMTQCFGSGPTYTFFFDPPGSSTAETQAAIDKSVADGTTQLGASPVGSVGSDTEGAVAGPPISVATPGYPRLCPSGRVIAAGTCANSGGLGNGVEPPVEPPVVTPPTGGVPFVSDSFTGPNGTLIMAHAPEVGGNWIRPYEINYGYDDCNWHLANNQLESNDWSCWGDDQAILNTAVPPSADYEISVEFTLNYDYTYLEAIILGRASLDDAIKGYLYLDDSGNSYAQIAAMSEGNVGFVDLPSLPMTMGKHTMKMSMVGTVFKLYYDGVLVHERSTSAIMDKGLAGFSMHHNGDPDYMSFDNFLAK